MRRAATFSRTGVEASGDASMNRPREYPPIKSSIRSKADLHTLLSLRASLASGRERSAPVQHEWAQPKAKPSAQSDRITAPTKTSDMMRMSLSVFMLNRSNASIVPCGL